MTLEYVENDFGALRLDLDLIQSCKVSLIDFDEVNTAIYKAKDSFDTYYLAGMSFNLCAMNNASVYFSYEGKVTLLIRNGAGFDVAAEFNTCGESESDLDAVYCAFEIRD